MTFFQPLFVGTTLYFGASTLKFDNKNAQHAKVRFNRCDIGEKFQFTQKFGQTFIVCVSEGAKLWPNQKNNKLDYVAYNGSRVL